MYQADRRKVTEMPDATRSPASAPVQSPDRAARRAGVLLLLAAMFTVAMVYTRVAADADQPTLRQSLEAVSEYPLMYVTSGIARLLSGMSFLAAGWLLLQTWIIRGRLATSLVPYLFVVSGGFTAASGGCIILTAVHMALDPVSTAGDSPMTDLTVLNWMSGIRWIAGKAGFAAAGVALIVASPYQWRVGGELRKIAPVSAGLGVAMQFIWFDAAAMIHPAIGTAFFLWLITIGSMLASGRVERRYMATYGSET